MRLYFLLLFATLLVACTESSDGVSGSRGNIVHTDHYKVAVILPLDSASGNHWKRTVQWFSDNLEKAFEISGLDSAIAFDIEWIDENTASMDSLGSSFARRDDLMAIVGPFQSDNLDTIASYCGHSSTTLIAPMATAEDVARKYIDEKWFFSLSETDITQCEKILDFVYAQGAKTITLLASNSPYGKTFIDWFPYLATEFGLDVAGLFTYDDSTQLESAAQSAMESKADFIIAAPDSYRNVPKIQEIHKKNNSESRIFYTSSVHNSNLLQYKDLEGIEGISIGANPTTGFDIAYIAKFRDYPMAGEAQVYDALLLSAVAQMYLRIKTDSTFNEAFTSATDKDSTRSDYLAWEYFGLAHVLESMHKGNTYNITGASGELSPEVKPGAIVFRSAYTHWKVDAGAIIPMEYTASDNSKRTSKTHTSINWIVRHYVEKFDSTAKFNYPKLQGNFALLIAASNTWKNYRHQADVLAMYSKLKSMGMDDDHIILILEDDLAYNFFNPNPGELYDSKGESLYENVQIDYKTSSLTPRDLYSILAGEKQDSLQQVIEGDSLQNLFVFWSGHGNQKRFSWTSNYLGEPFSYDLLTEMLKNLSQKRTFRKMLWIVETCYSGSVCKAFEDVGATGTMCITAANEYETSKAYIYNKNYGVYMTNNFTYNLMNKLQNITRDSKTDINLNELYLYTVRNTLGSHVSIYGEENFDNLYNSGIREFFTVQ